MPKKLNIGGQALIEGVMIRSPKYSVMAVRKNKNIIIKKEKIKLRKGRYYKLPIIRGFYNLIDMLVIGMRSLMWSADQQLGKPLGNVNLIRFDAGARNAGNRGQSLFDRLGQGRDIDIHFEQ